MTIQMIVLTLNGHNSDARVQASLFKRSLFAAGKGDRLESASSGGARRGQRCSFGVLPYLYEGSHVGQHRLQELKWHKGGTALAL